MRRPLRFAGGLVPWAILGWLGCAHAPRRHLEPNSPPNREAVSQMSQGVALAQNPQSVEQAKALLRRSIERDPRLWEARYNLAILLAEEGNWASAEALLVEANTQAPDAEDVVLALAEVKRRRGEPAGAIPLIEAFLKRHPEAMESRVQRIALLREAGQQDRALQGARELVALRPGDPRGLYELALTHVARKETELAELLLQQMRERDPSSPAVHRLAAQIAQAQGDQAAAFRHLKQAVALEPGDRGSRLQVAHALLRSGLCERASAEYRQLLERYPSDPDATWGWAAALRCQGTREHPEFFVQAQKLLAALLQRQPEHWEALLDWAALEADSLHHPTEARQLLQRFLKGAPVGHARRPEAVRRLAAVSNP